MILLNKKKLKITYLFFEMISELGLGFELLALGVENEHIVLYQSRLLFYLDIL